MDTARSRGEEPGRTDRLGPFVVSADSDSVARFAVAIGAPSDTGDQAVPATFPITWLAHPAIRAAFEGFARPGEVAFHEDQLFDYRAPLVRDAPYRLTVEISRVDSPARITAVSEVEDDGAPRMTMRTVLRLLDVTDGVNAGAVAS